MPWARSTKGAAGLDLAAQAGRSEPHLTRNNLTNLQIHTRRIGKPGMQGHADFRRHRPFNVKIGPEPQVTPHKAMPVLGPVVPPVVQEIRRIATCIRRVGVACQWGGAVSGTSPTAFRIRRNRMACWGHIRGKPSTFRIAPGNRRRRDRRWSAFPVGP